MCDTCGCSPNSDSFTLSTSSGAAHSHSHGHHHHHEHPHEHPHPQSVSIPAGESKTIHLDTDILTQNKLLAERNRGYFEAKEIQTVNLVSSPGSGKTTLLEKLIPILKQTREVYVIEGDQQTSNDARRIENAGAIAIQINTGNGCHLDAHMIRHAIQALQVSHGSLLFIENVGNLVCPALFDLGESIRIVIASTTEGEDKPLKYPNMFQSAQICILNKTDLLPHLDFRMDEFERNLFSVNPSIILKLLSTRNGDGLHEIQNLF